MDDQLAYESATDLLALISTKQVSPVEITEIFLNRIEKLDPKLHAFLFVDGELSMKAATVAEQTIMNGDQLGPLHGLPIPVKDSQNTANITTTAGSLMYKDRRPERDSAVVERIKGAGAIILGKTNIPEFAMVGTCENRLGEWGLNPWDTNRSPGGSSGGAAAAVASSLCPIATGSDGGGSLRIPAHFCGVYAIKPTQGRVSGYTGEAGPQMPYIFSQNGPLSKTVRDSALLLQVLSGHDQRDPTSLRESPPDYISAVNKNVAGLRIAWSSDFGFADVDSEVLSVTQKAAKEFENMGCWVEDANLVLDPPYDEYGAVSASDAFTTLGHFLETNPDELTEHAKFYLEIGSKVSASEYALTLGKMDLLKSKMAQFFENYDILLTPTACFPAFPNELFPGQIRGKSKYPEQYWNGAFTLPINVIGYPAASIPAGFSSDGLPIGLHIIGKKGDELTVLAVSAAFEQECPWINKRPLVS